MSSGYKGDVTVADCWTALQKDQDAFLIDVRTSAEWNYVGFPVLAALGRPVLFAEWQAYPSMAVDPDFVRRVDSMVEEAGGSKESRLYFLCRSGVRSMASAAAMTEAGYRNSFNILDGFEGPPDENGHRGHRSGWKAEGLPWAQR